MSTYNVSPSRFGRIARTIVSTNHKAVGIGYILISLVAVVIGTTLSLIMRMHLAWPNWPLPLHGLILPEEYLAMVTMHGTLMLFFVLTVAPQSGFGNLILPEQIGATRMAFPRLNAASMWLTAVALVVLCSAFFVRGGAPISGWTAYPPLSASALAGPGQGMGQDLWLLSIALFAIASVGGGINFLTTIIKLRGDGMSWDRLPLTVWGWFTAALLSILAFSVLLAALVMLFCDRHLHSGFFIPTGDIIDGIILHHRGDGSPLLWLHLFWFFGHPEVYIAILPGMGLTSMVIANFSRRPVFAYRMMIASTLLIGLLGMMVWGHHMFVAGLNPFAGSVFSLTSMAIAIPASAKVLSWLATVWRSRPRLTTPMLFVLGFVSLFIIGGLSGPILAQPILDEYLHNTFFVVAHFHLIMAMAGVFGLFCAIYYWFPILSAAATGKSLLLNESLGKLHFYATLLGAYATFLPMHLTGLAGEPRHYAQLSGVAGPTGVLLSATLPLQREITIAAIFLCCAQLPFLLNLILAFRSKATAPPNPWQATTMEWAPYTSSETLLTTHRGPCRYSDDAATFLPQWEPDTALHSDAQSQPDATPEPSAE